MMWNSLEIKGVRFGDGRPVICVPVVEREREDIATRVRTLTERGVQMIEWRADRFSGIGEPDALRAVLEDLRPITRDVVLLFTIRTEKQGGCATLSESGILHACEIAAKSGSIDLVDLEYFEREKPEREIRRLQQAGVRVIASHHDFQSTPDDVILTKLMEQLLASGADIAKLAVMPQSPGDVIRLLRRTSDTKQIDPDCRIITIAMGDLGVVSRVCGETFGSCVTFGADGEGSAPGQMQADTLAVILDALHSSKMVG